MDPYLQRGIPVSQRGSVGLLKAVKVYANAERNRNLKKYDTRYNSHLVLINALISFTSSVRAYLRPMDPEESSTR